MGTTPSTTDAATGRSRPGTVATRLEVTAPRQEPGEGGTRPVLQRARTTRAGTPATSVRGGTSFVTTAPAATTASSPTVTPCRTVAPAAIHTPRPMRIGEVVIERRRVAGSRRMA